MRADRLEEVIEAKIREVSGRAERPHLPKPAQQADDSAAGEHRQLQNTLERVKCRIARVFELHETGELDKAAIRERMAKLSAERGRVQATLAESREQRPSSAGDGRAAGDYDSLDEPGKRETLRAMVHEVVVKGRTVELVLAGLGLGGRERSTVSLLPDLDTTTPGGRLKKARLQAGLNQQEVADRLGVHVQCISNQENGRSKPRWVGIEELEGSIEAAARTSQSHRNSARAMSSGRRAPGRGLLASPGHVTDSWA